MPPGLVPSDGDELADANVVSMRLVHDGFQGSEPRRVLCRLCALAQLQRLAGCWPRRRPPRRADGGGRGRQRMALHLGRVLAAPIRKLTLLFAAAGVRGHLPAWLEGLGPGEVEALLLPALRDCIAAVFHPIQSKARLLHCTLPKDACWAEACTGVDGCYRSRPLWCGPVRHLMLAGVGGVPVPFRRPGAAIYARALSLKVITAERHGRRASGIWPDRRLDHLCTLCGRKGCGAFAPGVSRKRAVNIGFAKYAVLTLSSQGPSACRSIAGVCRVLPTVTSRRHPQRTGHPGIDPRHGAH